MSDVDDLFAAAEEAPEDEFSLTHSSQILKRLTSTPASTSNGITGRSATTGSAKRTIKSNSTAKGGKRKVLSDSESDSQSVSQSEEDEESSEEVDSEEGDTPALTNLSLSGFDPSSFIDSLAANMENKYGNGLDESDQDEIDMETLEVVPKKATPKMGKARLSNSGKPNSSNKMANKLKTPPSSGSVVQKMNCSGGSNPKKHRSAIASPIAKVSNNPRLGKRPLVDSSKRSPGKASKIGQPTAKSAKLPPAERDDNAANEQVPPAYPVYPAPYPPYQNYPRPGLYQHPPPPPHYDPYYGQYGPYGQYPPQPYSFQPYAYNYANPPLPPTPYPPINSPPIQNGTSELYRQSQQKSIANKMSNTSGSLGNIQNVSNNERSLPQVPREMSKGPIQALVAYEGNQPQSFFPPTSSSSSIPKSQTNITVMRRDVVNFIPGDLTSATIMEPSSIITRPSECLKTTLRVMDRSVISNLDFQKRELKQMLKLLFDEHDTEMASMILHVAKNRLKTSHLTPLAMSTHFPIFRFDRELVPHFELYIKSPHMSLPATEVISHVDEEILSLSRLIYDFIREFQPDSSQVAQMAYG